SRTASQRTRDGPDSMPNSADREISEATRALATRVLVGVQPTLMQQPPTSPRSTIAVRRPARANATASGTPACPDPPTSATPVRIGTARSTLQSPRTQRCRACASKPPCRCPPRGGQIPLRPRETFHGFQPQRAPCPPRRGFRGGRDADRARPPDRGTAGPLPP